MKMTRSDLFEHLVRLGACSEAVDWVERTPGTPEELWLSCPEPVWCMSLASLAKIDNRLLLLAACDCARLYSAATASAAYIDALAGACAVSDACHGPKLKTECADLVRNHISWDAVRVALESQLANKVK